MLPLIRSVATTGAPHVHHDSDIVTIKPDNVSLEPKHGNSLAYTLDRIKRERPAVKGNGDIVTIKPAR